MLSRTWRARLALVCALSLVGTTGFPDIARAQEASSAAQAAGSSTQSTGTSAGSARTTIKPFAPVSLGARMRYQAGGWGFLAPLIELGTRAVEATQMKNATLDQKFSYATKFARSPKFWGGLAGDLLFTTVAGAMASCIPGGAFVTEFLICAAGFAGWELGSGNIKETNWPMLFFQSAVFTAVSLGVAALGIPCAGLFAMVAAFAAGLVMDQLFDGEEEIALENGYDEEVDGREQGTAAAPFAPSEDAAINEAEAAAARQAEAEAIKELDDARRLSYFDYMEALRTKRQGPEVEEALRRYQANQRELEARRSQAAAASGN